VSFREPVASPARIRFTVELSKTAGKASMARESGAPSERRPQSPSLRARSRGSFILIERSRTASPAERPLEVRSWRDSRKGRRSLRLGVFSGPVPVPDKASGSAAFVAGFRAAAAGAAPAWGSAIDTTVSPRADRMRTASFLPAASIADSTSFPEASRAL